MGTSHRLQVMSPDGKTPVKKIEDQHPQAWPMPPGLPPIADATNPQGSSEPHPSGLQPVVYESTPPATQPRNEAFYRGFASPAEMDQSVTPINSSPAWLQREVMQEEHALSVDVHDESHEASWLMQQAEQEMLGLANDSVDSDLTVGSSDIGLSRELSMMMDSPPHMPTISTSLPASASELSPTQHVDHQHAPVSPIPPAVIHTASELPTPEGQAQPKRTKFDDHVQQVEIQQTQEVPSPDGDGFSVNKPVRPSLRGAHHDSHPYNPRPSSSSHPAPSSSGKLRALSERLGGTTTGVPASEIPTGLPTSFGPSSSSSSSGIAPTVGFNAYLQQVPASPLTAMHQENFASPMSAQSDISASAFAPAPSSAQGPRPNDDTGGGIERWANHAFSPPASSEALGLLLLVQQAQGLRGCGWTEFMIRPSSNTASCIIIGPGPLRRAWCRGKCRCRNIRMC